MKVSKAWLQQLVDLKVSLEEVERLLPLRSIGTKDITDQFIELDMKGYNRADLLSMRGVATEIAAITDSAVTFEDPDETTYSWMGKELPQVSVEVTDQQMCPMYCLAQIEGVSMEPSPKEWIQKLEDCGMRSVNRLVDVTNLIMLEYGQPLHAFDGDAIADGKIIVRTAQDGEELVTLDDKKRVLQSTDLVIADPEKAVGLAGVMGGKNSEIGDNADVVYLEAAIFDPITLRKTASRLGLHSEASKRFQHGLTKKRLLQALNAAITMLGGELAGFTMVGDTQEKEVSLQLQLEKVNSLIGIELSGEQVESYLSKLHFHIQSTGQDSWEVKVPYFRLDIALQEDLIEEIARMYGYERIPAKPLEGELPEKIDQGPFEKLYQIKEAAVALGLTEVQSYSYYSSKAIENLGYKTEELLRVSNPISVETQFMRQNIWPNLVEFVDKNIRQGFKDIAMFEIGKVYYPTKEGMPSESYRLSIALLNETNNPAQELLVIVKELFKQISVTMDFEQNTLPEDFQGSFHPNRYVEAKLSGELIGGVAEVHPKLSYAFGMEKRVAVAEFDLTGVLLKPEA